MLCVIGIMFITGIKYFSVESYRYRTCFTADADYHNYDKELEKRKLEEYLDAVKRNKDITKEKYDQLRDFNRIRANQGVEKVKDKKLHRQKTETNTESSNSKKRRDNYDDFDFEESVEMNKQGQNVKDSLTNKKSENRDFQEEDYDLSSYGKGRVSNRKY